MARQWKIMCQEGWDKSIRYETDVPIPSAEDLGPRDVLVKLNAASLNFRDIMIPAVNASLPRRFLQVDCILTQVQSYHGLLEKPVVAGCDGAGEVLAAGTKVTEFKVGDRVVTHCPPATARKSGDDAPVSLEDALAGLGQGLDGSLRSVGVFDEKALVLAPQSIDWLQAGTLTCVWGTAYNVLFGVKGHEVTRDSWVLIEGTGGVSIAVLQLAVAEGATVVAVTSSDEKADRLRSLGASHVINYRVESQWGTEARKLTPNGRGFDFCADIGGDSTVRQALAAMRADCYLSVLSPGASPDPVPLGVVTYQTCIARGFLGGTRSHMKAVCRYIDEKRIKPATDDVVFELADAMSAYRRLAEKKHFAKVLIRIDH